MATVDDLTFTLSSDGTYYTVKATSTAISGALEIPAEYSGLPVKAIASAGFKNCSALTSVVVPESITAIPYEGFRSCGKLTSISLPAGLTSIGSAAFYNCSSLTSISLPAGLTSIGSYAFRSCSSLTGEIVIPAKVNSIGQCAFGYCNNISLAVDSANTTYHADGNCIIKTATNQLVQGCKVSVIPSYITSLYDRAFEGFSFTSIELPAGLTSIGYAAFQYCSKLTSISLPAGLTSIGSAAFQYCSSLTSIELPAGLTSIGSAAFYNCSKLTSIELPAGLTSIGQQAFYNCSSLTGEIVIPAKVSSIGNGAFGMDAKITSITVDSANTTYHSEGNCCIKTATNQLTFGCKNSVIPSYITSLYDRAFQGVALTSISLPAGLTSIGNYAFVGCSKLTSFKFEGDAVAEATNVLGDTSKLTAVHVNAFSTGYGTTWGGKTVVVDNPVYLGGERIKKAYLGETRVRKFFNG